MSSLSANGRTSAREASGRLSSGDPLHVVLSTVASDSHTWNLLYLQLLLQEHGHRVTNLGPCTPTGLVLRTCRLDRPDLLTVSTVNGHGHRDGRALIEQLRQTADIAAIPAVIGGKLSLTGSASGYRRELLDAGYQAVFDDADGGSASEFFDTVIAGVRRGAFV